ncbi:MAG: type II toxin-antitoxin system HicB family antitoxin [Chloroflexi bacterium]|nr:type II toxin-antitoxin system HicB family antitoxin [Chloroflexota bacterium]
MPDKAYVDSLMARAVYRLFEDGTVFGEIPGSTGVWANEATLERCQVVLRKVLEEWLYLKRRHHEDVRPVPVGEFGGDGAEDK